MSLFKGKRLAISLPAIELARINVPSSVFNIDELDTGRLSPDLQAELDRVITTFSLATSDVYVISRSEMFTHGATLAWLRARLSDVHDHLCFSDGSSLKTLPSYANHVYFFRPSCETGRGQLARLLLRAPELFASCSSQINSAYGSAVAGLVPVPETVLLQGRSRWLGEPSTFFPFYLDPGCIDHTLEVARAEPYWTAQAASRTRTTVVCCTEASLAQSAFVRYVARLILSIIFMPSRGLVLVAPALDFGGASAEERLSTVYRALAPHLGDLPRVRASNIGLMMGELESLRLHELAAGMHNLLLPASSAFWRCGTEFYAPLARVVIFPDSLSFETHAGYDLYATALGRSPVVAVVGDGMGPTVTPEIDL